MPISPTFRLQSYTTLSAQATHPSQRNYFGKSESWRTAQSKQQVWAPAGFARGFCVLSEYAEIEYLCTGVYNPKGESGVLWNDPEIGIEWPVKDPILSDKDRRAQTLAEWRSRSESAHFRFS